VRSVATIVVATISLASLGLAPAAQAEFGITSFDGLSSNQDGSADTQAGSHPFEASASFSLTSTTDSSGSLTPDGNARDIEVELPAGFVGNPTATPTCTKAQLAASNPNPPFDNGCPLESQVGVTEIAFTLGGSEPSLLRLPVYNMVAPPGSPAQFGFNVIQFPTYATARVRSGGDYGVTVSLSPISQATPFIGGSFTLWGVPAATAHDGERGVVCFSGSCFSSGAPSTAQPRPFLTNPMSCAAGPLKTTMRADSWQDPGDFKVASFVSHLTDGTPAGVDGCSRLSFSPALTVRPDTSSADSPAGLSVDLHLPQSENPQGLAEAMLKRAVVTLPAGVSVNPAAAEGLTPCTPGQIGLDRPDPPACPDAAKIGTVEVLTPLLDHPLDGSVYVATPGDNPFGSLLAIYIALDDPQTGVVVKLAGHVVADPGSGQLTTTFDDNPQLPFSDLRLRLFGGPRGVLRTPSTCGTYATAGAFSPWSASDPDNPAPSEVADTESRFAIDHVPQGSCPGPSFEPRLSAGTANPVAGRYSPFQLRLLRDDGTQQLGRIDLTLPRGLTGKLAGIPYCPDATLAAIPTREGTGAAEFASPSCPAASQVGTLSAGAGAGPSPFFVDTGRAYLAGPYRGAPLSLAIVTPALAGPFDLGNVVVRSALRVNRETAQIEAVSDPIPTILDGIPLDLRDLRLAVDRPSFVLNPTSCAPQQLSGSASSAEGATAPLTVRFQVGSCASLGFAPKLSMRLFGKTNRGAHPRFQAVLRTRRHDANIARAQVSLPRSEFLDQGHIRTVCTRVQFAAERCPADSIYGRARAVTPLLDQPLQGPVYLRSSSHELPDLVAALHGQVDIDLVGRIDSFHSGIRTTFEAVPDAPVSRFTLTMEGGPKGLLVNSRNLCRTAYLATVRLEGQNGRTADQRPRLRSSCRGKGRG
jgi:hypothetical protein